VGTQGSFSDAYPNAARVLQNRTFGRGRANGQLATNTGDGEKQKVQLWLNIGYWIPGETEDDDDRFVSLPMGIGLDTMGRLATNSSNLKFADFQAARNGLLDQLMEIGNKLAPGEERSLGLGDDSPLCLQIRRVSEEKAERSVEVGVNRFVKKLFEIA
jgi:hypothetical protein